MYPAPWRWTCSGVLRMQCAYYKKTCDRRRWSGIDRQHHRLGRPRRRRASAHPGAPHARWTQQASPTARGRTACWPTPRQTTRATSSPNRCPTVRPSTTAQRSPVHCISHPAVARGRRWLRTTRTWLRTACSWTMPSPSTSCCSVARLLRSRRMRRWRGPQDALPSHPRARADDRL